LASAALALTVVDFWDELASGLPTAGAPAVRSAFGVDVATLTFVVFTLSGLLALVVTTPLLLWAERRPRASMIALGLLGMAVSVGLCGLSGSVAVFALAFALYAPACDLACGLAQAALMDLDPEARERRMAAWTFAGTVGDLAAPPLIALAVVLGDFRVAWFATAAGLVVMALAIRRLRLPSSPSGDLDSDREPANGSLRGALRAGLENRRLLLWLCGVTLCALMDETLTVLVAFWAHERFPNEPHASAWILTATTAGSALGLVLLDRLLGRFSARRLLTVACAGTLLSYAPWLGAVTLPAAAFWAFLAGVLIAWQYPLAQAQAYRAAGARSGLVPALSAPLTVFELVAPVLLGFIADRAGVTMAMTLLLVQPLGLLLVLSWRRAALER
jgi:MFS family permease